MQGATPSIRTTGNAPALLRRALALSLFWWALTGGQPGAWWFYLPALLIAARLPDWLTEPSADWSLRWRGLVPFVLYFVHHSILGGLDVARRAMKPVIPLEPDLHFYELSLTSASARIFLAHVVSLLPGTLSADLCGATLTVHALSGSAEEVQRDLRILEGKVAGLMEGRARAR